MVLKVRVGAKEGGIRNVIVDAYILLRSEISSPRPSYLLKTGLVSRARLGA